MPKIANTAYTKRIRCLQLELDGEAADGDKATLNTTVSTLL